MGISAWQVLSFGITADFLFVEPVQRTGTTVGAPHQSVFDTGGQFSRYYPDWYRVVDAPRCTVNRHHLGGFLVYGTSAVCVTGLVPVDVSTTFTTGGLVVIILLIQIGGLGVMTLTSFFAMFFMGNTSLYNQLVVRDMVSSNSLGSLLSTLLYILGFTLVIEGIGMISIWFSIHGTLGMNFEDELAFSAFHSISAFCNAGFSTLSGNLGNSMVMTNHNGLFISVSLLIILGRYRLSYPC